MCPSTASLYCNMFLMLRLVRLLPHIAQHKRRKLHHVLFQRSSVGENVGVCVCVCARISSYGDVKCALCSVGKEIQMWKAKFTIL